jgi:hypothetical protein
MSMKVSCCDMLGRTCLLFYVIWHSSLVSVEAQVPGSVYTDLYKSGVIGDPYYRFNDLAYSWIGYADWIYSKTFSGN